VGKSKCAELRGIGTMNFVEKRLVKPKDESIIAKTTGKT
jgi:hypothetical protein